MPFPIIHCMKALKFVRSFSEEPATRFLDFSVKISCQAADRPRRWIILVAAGQEDLYEHLCGALRADEQVEVIMDRRRDHGRNPPGSTGACSLTGPP